MADESIVDLSCDENPVPDESANDSIIDSVEKAGAPIVEAAEKVAERVAAKAVVVSDDALSAAQRIDRLILRVNKLLASPSGLSSFLSTFNYTLYILAYLQTKTPSASAYARKLLALLKSSPVKPPTTTLIANGATPSLAALAVLISRTRTTLRLFGLFPLYAWLRTLLAGPKSDADPVLHRIALLQASSYFTYQALENVSVLADHGVVSKSFIARINRGEPTTARVYLWAYRAWLAGVSCDFLRLGREAHLETNRRYIRSKMREDGRELATYQDEEDQKVDAKWWTDFMIASAWLPMALHFSSGKGGLPGWNLGWMGMCGLVAGSPRMSGLWASTLQS
ncbi:hypothetical protein BDV95DRAFT_515433 [Massariosphaeria phaeospora]|uniref:Uncharacterized protein n=1 Tax=Massariosphaeria phaeospora TaxID=100035 RepID=A0A7C8IKR5_9PLEO|nr:hypothetical protein BDV95DRAFT_515433 [Massariosphaeria phaeospora]